MFRLIRLIILLVLIAAVVIGVYLYMARVPTVERFLSKRLNAEVIIDEVDLSFSSITIKKLRIKNPAQSSLPYAFQAATISLHVSPFELFREKIHIDRVKIHNPTVGIELYNASGTENNWALLINRMPATNSKKFVIKKLTITNLQFDILRSNGKPINVPPIPYLEFDNLGESGALTVAQIGRILFQTILSSLKSQAHLNALLENVSQIPQSLLDGVNSTLPIEDIRGRLQEGIDTIRRKGKEATNFLQDIFK